MSDSSFEEFILLRDDRVHTLFLIRRSVFKGTTIRVGANGDEPDGPDLLRKATLFSTGLNRASDEQA